MPRTKAKRSKKENNSAKLGFEETLWQAADKLRGHLDAAEYKHVVLGLIFLKYISDAFDELYQQRYNPPHLQATLKLSKSVHVHVEHHDKVQ